MTAIAPHVTAFFHQRLTLERRASVNTCDSYAYAFKMLLGYASKHLKVTPSKLELEQIDAPLVVGFLNDLEAARSNGTSSRNVRLAAIKSFMRFMGYRVPSALEQIQRVLAIPMKNADSRCAASFDRRDTGTPGCTPTRQLGRHPGPCDAALVFRCRTACVGTHRSSAGGPIPTSASGHCRARQGRRERCLPLWKQTAAALRAWLVVRGVAPAPEIFVNARREPLTRSGFEYVLEKHATPDGSLPCPSLAAKRLSPHVLRHSCALTILQVTKDLRKVSLWLGHANMQTTEIYTRADPSIKLESFDQRRHRRCALGVSGRATN